MTSTLASRDVAALLDKGDAYSVCLAICLARYHIRYILNPDSKAKDRFYIPHWTKTLARLGPPMELLGLLGMRKRMEYPGATTEEGLTVVNPKAYLILRRAGYPARKSP